MNVFANVSALSRASQGEDAYWVSRCREGDDQALAVLISRHRERLIRTAAHVLRDRHEAEDVAQESFLKAFRELHRIRDDRAFAGYLYRICVRLCMDRMRARRPEPVEFDLTERGPGMDVENRIVLEKLLKQLSPDLRMTLVLREVEQLNYEEIAAIMKVPVGTVRSRLHNAREKLRKLWLEAVKDPA